MGSFCGIWHMCNKTIQQEKIHLNLCVFNQVSITQKNGKGVLRSILYEKNPCHFKQLYSGILHNSYTSVK